MLAVMRRDWNAPTLCHRHLTPEFCAHPVDVASDTPTDQPVAAPAGGAENIRR
jgi:hypothetical protein